VLDYFCKTVKPEISHSPKELRIKTESKREKNSPVTGKVRRHHGRAVPLDLNAHL
jgi:hypothetical protein